MTHLLNHVELYYRSEDFDSAVLLLETMGCTVADVTKQFGSSSTYTAVYPGPVEGDPLNNVFYLSEQRQPSPLEGLLDERAKSDPELNAAIETTRTNVKRLGGAQHFGLRFDTFEELEAIMDRLLNALPPELKGRVTVTAPFAHPLKELGTEVMQSFVHTDLIGCGTFPFGQLIELQAQRPIEQSR